MILLYFYEIKKKIKDVATKKYVTKKWLKNILCYRNFIFVNLTMKIKERYSIK